MTLRAGIGVAGGESGAAVLVDGATMELWSPASENGSVRVCDGDVVEVAGRGGRVTRADPTAEVYRGGVTEIFELRGNDDDPAHLVLHETRSTGPRARVSLAETPDVEAVELTASAADPARARQKRSDA